MSIIKKCNFDLVFESVVPTEEGGFNVIAGDRGGATQFGISLRFLKLLPLMEADINGDGHVDIEDVRDMTMKQAKVFYKKHFWDHYKIDRYTNIALQEKMFSFLINMRSRMAIKCLQRATRSVGYKLVDDGLAGNKTFEVIDRIVQMNLTDELITSLKSEAAGFYRIICIFDKIQLKFLNGWLNRAYR